MDRSFLKHAATYGLATFLVQAGGFVLLPIYLRCLTPADYGVLEVVGRLAETVGAILLLGGFRQALFTFYQQAEAESERRRVVLAAYALVALAGLVGALVLIGLTPWLSSAELPPWLLYLAVFGILLEPFSLLPLTLIQARVESGTYVVVVVAQFLFRVSLCIVLVRFLHWGVAGALLATAATGTVFGILLSLRELRRGIARPTLAHFRSIVAFALPLLPSALCYFVMHHGDRFFLMRHATSAEIGTYALGYKLAMIVRLLSLVPLYMVWSSRMYAVAKQPDASEVFGRVMTRTLAAYLFAGLGVCLFAPEIILVLGGDEYLAAVPIVAPVVLACGLQAATTLMDAAFFLTRRTGIKLAVSLLTTFVMLILYATLIPGWGVTGAVVATVGGFTFLAPASYFVTQRIFLVQYEWRRLALSLLLTLSLWWVGSRFPVEAWAIVAKAGLLLAAPVIAWVGNLVRADEKQAVLDLTRSAWLWCRRTVESPA